MGTQIERMSQSMFPIDHANVVNVKFFMGRDRKVTAEDLADQLDRADAQIRSGAASRSTSLDAGLTVKDI